MINSRIDSNNTASLHDVLKNCADIQSNESLALEEINDFRQIYTIRNSMVSTKSYSNGSVSGSAYPSEESTTDSTLLEENGRISLAYENLRTIPRQIAEKFATQTKFLDLSHNNLQNLSFLSFFEDLHTLILDQNVNLDVNTFPYLPNLKILWINNCGISNITEWIDAIERQCPSLNHLSMMGNPEIKNKCYSNSLPVFTLINTTALLTEPIIDLHEYILHVMPNLKYLNGILLYNDMSTRISCHSKSSRPSPKESSTSDNNLQSARKLSPTLRFRDILRLRQRKPSSSTSTSN